jgi:AraC-like DNA-binding protein
MSAPQMEYWQPAAEAGLDLGCCRLAVQQTVLHLHEEWQFAVPETPGRLSLGAFRRYEAKVQEVAVVAPYRVHGEGSVTAESTGWHLLYVTPGFLNDLYGGVPVFPRAIIPDPSSALELRELIDQSIEGALDRSELLARAASWLQHLLACAAERRALPGPASAVDRVRAYLQAHRTEAVNLDELLTAASISPSATRSFSRVVGLPLKSYHTQLRLARARRLLTQGRSATWVAYECGFADQAHLSRRFKECHGVTPGVFQAQWRSSTHDSLNGESPSCKAGPPIKTILVASNHH